MYATGKNLDAAVADIMERFDFRKVRRTMEFLNWTWAGRGVPTEVQLRGTADQLLQGVIRHWRDHGTNMTHATGGFEAQIRNIDGQEPELRLFFYVDSTHAQGEY